ncbi:keratin, type I cytoskeletal 47 kDa-like [Scyliorhinus canicula]|uniref:keratin, type I cytoskeletal 47 kDa-like n=1 Tax=Scyliorhinus canicula TaxID=7830 RepID=UPI0018F61AAB|nr:keratin, type I cytoskeletal 47 kDa-like [Scyliorhinus canicula]
MSFGQSSFSRKSYSVQGGNVSRMSSLGSSSGRASGARISMGGSRSLGMGGSYGGSSSFGLGSSLGGGSSISTSSVGGANEKVAMQNLNDRLAHYLEQVRSLETSNSKMELEIRQYYEKAGPATRDWSAYWATINGLRGQINDFILDNSRLMLQIDNSKLAAEDFRSKFEAELGIRMSVDADIHGLRTMLDDMTLKKSQLEMEIESLKEELIYIRKNHEETLRGLRGQISGNVNVEVTTEPTLDLVKLLNEMREEYDQGVKKNKAELENWYSQQVVTVKNEYAVNTDVIKTETSQLTQLRHTYQGLEMEYQGLLSMISSLEANLGDVENSYCMKRDKIQININRLEAEMMELRLKLDQNVKSYAMLLDSKNQLEMEIETYRRLMNTSGQALSGMSTISSGKTVLIKTEKREPVVTKVVKTVVEETINGEVVKSYSQNIIQ